MTRFLSTVTAIAIAVSVCISPPFVIGEDSTTFHARGARYVGGTWVNTDSKGIKHEHVYSWALGGRFLTVEDRTASKPVFSVVGIDPTTGARTWWDFSSDGSVSVAVTTDQATGPNAFEGSFKSDDGKSEGKYTEKFTTIDRLEVTIDGKVSGEPMTGLQIWERSPTVDSSFKLTSEPPTTIPPAMSMLAPKSTFASTSGQLPTGEKYVGAWASDWILGGKFVRLTESFVLENHQTANYMFILGVDPKTNQAVGWEFDSDGAVGKFIMAPDGKSLKGKVQLTAKEAMEYQGTFRHDASGAMVYEATAKIGDGPAKSYHVTSRKPGPP